MFYFFFFFCEKTSVFTNFTRLLDTSSWIQSEHRVDLDQKNFWASFQKQKTWMFATKTRRTPPPSRLAWAHLGLWWVRTWQKHNGTLECKTIRPKRNIGKKTHPWITTCLSQKRSFPCQKTHILPASFIVQWFYRSRAILVISVFEQKALLIYYQMKMRFRHPVSLRMHFKSFKPHQVSLLQGLWFHCMVALAVNVASPSRK